MNTSSESVSLSRREFFQLAALSAATASVIPDILWAERDSSTDIRSGGGEKRFDADVVVIGGGIAGTFAAMTARAKGLSVVLADKGTVGIS